MTQPLKLGHVHLKVRNLQSSVDFYCNLFGLKVEERVHSYAFLSDGAVHHSIALQALGDEATSPARHAVGLYHVAFEVGNEEEYQAFREKLEAMGIRSQSMDHGISWAIYFSDPDGNGLEVYLDRRHSPGGRSSWVDRQVPADGR